MVEPEPHIERVLVLSTAHLRQSTCNEWMVEHQVSLAAYQKGDVGWWMHVRSDAITDGWHSAEPATPNELRVIMDYAQRFDCDWIMFDRDADTLDGLVVYDW